MSIIPGTNIASKIVPFDTADTFPTHDPLYGIGGWREVADIATRDAIPAARLRAGMVVYSQADNIGFVYTGTGWTVLAGTLAPVIDVACFVPGTLIDTQVLLHYEIRHACSFPTNLAGSKCVSLVAATGSTTITIKRNGSSVGTMVFSAGQSLATLTLTTFTAAIGDYLDFACPVADSSLSGVTFTIVASRLS